jgi:cytosine deaminase
MSAGFAAVPAAPRYSIANATLPAAVADASLGPADGEGLVTADIVVAAGRIEAVGPAGTAPALPRLDLDRGLVFPAFVDMHTHIDKGHIWPRRPNPDGTFASALDAVAIDRAADWSAEDVAARMEFALRTAYAHGTALLRTHIDSLPPQHAISWPVFAEMRDRWAGRIDLQGVALYAIDAILDDGFARDIAATVRRHGGLLGAATFMIPELDRALERVFRLAIDNGLDLDFHVDESEDPAARSLRVIADTALRLGFAGRITVGHCCSLALQPAAEANETLARVADAGIAVVSLPMCNMYLQDRHAGRTPRWRGVTLLHEMRDRGIPVAVASDNTRDPFYAYGDLDMLEVFREAVRTLHFDHPFGDWPSTVASSPAAILGRPDRGVIAAGTPADLVLFRARTFTELLSRPQADRTVLRSGTAIDRTLPDYRELDALMRPSP